MDNKWIQLFLCVFASKCVYEGIAFAIKHIRVKIPDYEQGCLIGVHILTHKRNKTNSK